jgi:2,4-dienoyl-CoA reductase-like NADH-dependent reductase (Old Yellow Enzyme family)
VLQVIRAIRDQVPDTFCVGVKINTADFRSSTQYSDMISQIGLVKKEKVDYINLSGGSFEDPKVCMTRVIDDPSPVHS